MCSAVLAVHTAAVLSNGTVHMADPCTAYNEEYPSVA